MATSSDPSAPTGSAAGVGSLIMGNMAAIDSHESGDKLDRLLATTTDTRLAIAQIAGELREMSRRLDRNDLVNTDVEQRLRGLERALSTHSHEAHEASAASAHADFERRMRDQERFRYGIPSIAVVLGVLSLLLSLWVAFR